MTFIKFAPQSLHLHGLIDMQSTSLQRRHGVLAGIHIALDCIHIYLASKSTMFMPLLQSIHMSHAVCACKHQKRFSPADPIQCHMSGALLQLTGITRTCAKRRYKISILYSHSPQTPAMQERKGKEQKNKQPTYTTSKV